MLMAARRVAARLIDRLPAVRGELSGRRPLGALHLVARRAVRRRCCSFRPTRTISASSSLRCPAMCRSPPSASASNLLIRDGGIPGVVIRLRNAFAAIERTGGGVRAGAGALDINVARYAADEGLSGLEFLSGIPGTIGGALRMNAGAYGGEIKDVLVRTTAVDRRGIRHTIDASAMGFDYRHCSVPEDWIFLSADLSAIPAHAEEIAQRMDAIGVARNDTQPVRSRTGGSTFKNPSGKRAWQLIDEAGCRGLAIGNAMVSEKHCNFLINTGNATAQELESLGEEVRRRVRAHSGVDLQWEIKRIGIPAGGERP